MRFFLAFLLAFLPMFQPAYGAQRIIGADIVEGTKTVKNYLGNKGHFEKNVNGWSAYADAAGTRPVDMTGGSPNSTCTRTTSSPLSGDGSLLITHNSGASRQGEGCSVNFSIDVSDTYKVLQIEFDYILASGTFTAGSSSTDSDIIVDVYDVTNSTLIEPSSVKLFSNSTTVPSHYVANFQTTGSTSYRLGFHMASSSNTSAYTWKADNLAVSPSVYTYGTPITDWVTYTPTFSAGWGSPINTQTFYSRRVGDSLEGYGKFTTATVAGSAATITVGYNGGNGNVTIDTSKVPTNSIVGTAQSSLSGATFFGVYPIAPSSNATTIAFTVANSTTQFGSGAQNGNVVSTNTSAFSVHYMVPIVGWSSSVQMSDSSPQSVVVAAVTNSGNVTINTTATDLTFDTKLTDTTGSFSSPSFTVPVAGQYKISGVIRVDAGGSAPTQFILTLYKNGSSLNDLAAPTNFTASKAHEIPFHYTSTFKAGDALKLSAVSSTNTSTLIGTNSYVTFERISGPNQIAATETVAMNALPQTPTGTMTTAFNVIKFGSVTSDSHGGYSTGTGLYTVPAAGKYKVYGAVEITNSFTAGQTARINVYKNGTGGTNAGSVSYVANGTETGVVRVIPYVGMIDCVAGDTIAPYLYINASSASYSASFSASSLFIERIK